MVRAIFGTLLEINENKKSLDDFKKIIEGKDKFSWPLSSPSWTLSKSQNIIQIYTYEYKKCKWKLI